MFQFLPFFFYLALFLQIIRFCDFASSFFYTCTGFCVLYDAKCFVCNSVTFFDRNCFWLFDYKSTDQNWWCQLCIQKKMRVCLLNWVKSFVLYCCTIPVAIIKKFNVVTCFQNFKNVDFVYTFSASTFTKNFSQSNFFFILFLIPLPSFYNLLPPFLASYFKKNF